MTTSSTQSRFSGVATAPPDAILGLTEAFNADSNPNKMNLSVGVYQDRAGVTPVLKCVKEAERRLLETERSKGYLAISGMPDYCHHVHRLVFGESFDASRLAILQTPGGTGGLRIAAGFLASQISPKCLWMPNPTWANHRAVFESESLTVDSYRYLGDDRKTLDYSGMIEELKTKPAAGDVVLLHACCHNPTGVDPTPEQWAEIAKVVSDRQLLPLIDFAYQGFAAGLEEDAASVRAILECCDEAIVCNSFSKNFGLYSERVGAVSLVAGTSETATAAMSQLKRLARSNYSNPPRHGGAIVATVLDDDELSKLWVSEVGEMRSRIKNLREQFVTTMKSTGKGHDFSFLLKQNGMFSFSGLNPMQVDRLRNEHSIYIVGSGRINVAGMNEDRMTQLCDAIAEVLED